jgi:Protein of unknown function (DUF3226)
MPSPRLLLVEGPEDREVMYHLFNRFGIPRGVIDVEPEEGVETLISNLDRWLRRSELQQLGVVVDADVDVAARWDAIRGRLGSLGYRAFRRRLPAGGAIAQHGDEPTVGIWIMPDNSSMGMLEHFLSALVPVARAGLWKQACDAVSATPEGERLFIPEHLIKAQLHTFLAWQNEPGRPLGLSITKGFLDASAPAADHLRNWLRRLFRL